ncbi:glycosyltransferase family 9 protein [Haematospirillum sp. H1815]|uniref:glycosyltransferase family 9 protein n=1 Tax=Haematospirillum sp. H1815 TaxID=2723108 RepID=UPI002AC37103|nr:glycosyltransferase family 9 protein [Haematospirillum sp. H1815]
MSAGLQRILVIKLSALGDFVQAFGPFAALRAAHPRAHITLLTTAPYVALAEASPWFDAVWTDSRPRIWQVPSLLALRSRLRGGRFDRVYDLQTSWRSSSYRRLIGGDVEWNGIARGCSHPHDNPQRDLMHTVERQAEQLHVAGIEAIPSLDFSWLERGTLSCGSLPDGPFALLVPGGAPHRPDKRWPADHYAALARVLLQSGQTPVVIGTAAEQSEADAIMSWCPGALSLVGRTSIIDLAVLARRATLAVGNDTGPMHLLAGIGCRSVVLYSSASDPRLCGQRGPDVIILQSSDLAAMPVAHVCEALGLPGLDSAG